MKKFLLISALFFIGVTNLALAFDIPSKPNTYINDYANILSQDEIQKLEEKVGNFEKETSNEIVVVIISSLDGDTIENIANEIFNTWGIGKEDKNNGALFVASIEDRKMRIEVGYGLEGALTDIGTAYIQDYTVRPLFKDSNYYGGIDGALDAMIGLSKGEYIVPEDNLKEKLSSIFDNLWYVIFFLMFIFQFLAAVLGRSKSWWAGGVVGGVFGFLNIIINFFVLSLIVNLILLGGLVGLGLLFDYFVSKKYKDWKDKGGGGNPPWFIGGGGFGGKSSGSFGGFGGGSSGGGGSSSSW